jgi:hypothetical protein
MARWPSGKRWRWVVGVALSAVLVYWLAVHRRLLLALLLASSRNVAWHAVHRNNLQLSRTIYTVPLAWYVSSESPSFAFLTATRYVRPTMVSLKDGMEREDIPFESMFTSERDSFASRGKLIVERRRVRTGFEEDLCLEGTQQFSVMPTLSNVSDRQVRFRSSQVIVSGSIVTTISSRVHAFLRKNTCSCLDPQLAKSP